MKTPSISIPAEPVKQELREVSIPAEPVKQELREVLARVVQACEAAGGIAWTTAQLETELCVIRSRFREKPE